MMHWQRNLKKERATSGSGFSVFTILEVASCLFVGRILVLYQQNPQEISEALKILENQAVI